jgi:hypothetical protein
VFIDSSAIRSGMMVKSRMKDSALSKTGICGGERVRRLVTIPRQSTEIGATTNRHPRMISQNPAMVVLSDPEDLLECARSVLR